MKKHSVSLAVVAGCCLVVFDMMNRQPGAFLISGCILLGAALVTAHARP